MSKVNEFLDLMILIKDPLELMNYARKLIREFTDSNNQKSLNYNQQQELDWKKAQEKKEQSQPKTPPKDKGFTI